MLLPVEVSERGTSVLGMTVEAGKSNLRGLEALNLFIEGGCHIYKPDKPEIIPSGNILA